MMETHLRPVQGELCPNNQKLFLIDSDYKCMYKKFNSTCRSIHSLGMPLVMHYTSRAEMLAIRVRWEVNGSDIVHAEKTLELLQC